MTKNIKILISEKNERIIESIKNYFSNKPAEVYFCDKDGKVLIKEIDKLFPDVVVCDIFMKNHDAISVKEAVQHKGTSKIFIIASSCDNDDIIKRTMAAGFNYYFIKPFAPENLYSRILSFLTDTCTNKNPSLTDVYINRILKALDMPAHLKGYRYIYFAVKLVINNPDYINSITKKLYPEIANEFETTASRVERAVRTAIETVWRRAPMDVIEKYFPYYAASYTKPSNSEFIAYIADTVRNEITYEKLSWFYLTDIA